MTGSGYSTTLRLFEALPLSYIVFSESESLDIELLTELSLLLSLSLTVSLCCFI